MTWTYSASQVNLYNECPQKWYYQYVERWRPKKKPDYFRFGNAIHDALALIQTGTTNFKEFFPALLGKKDDFELATGLAMLNTCVKALRDFRPTTPPEKRIDFEIRGKKITGRIDARGFINKVEYLVDWKTTNKPVSKWTKRDAELSLQLKLYCLAENLPRAALGVIQKTMPARFKWLRAEFSKQDLEAAKETILGTIKGIESKNFYRWEGEHCRWCSFNPLCFKTRKEAMLSLAQR